MSHHISKGHCQTCSIRSASIFALLPDERLQEIKNFHPSVMSFIARETIYHQGDVSPYTYTVRSGVVKLVKTLANGRSQIVRILREGDLFGFEGFIGQCYMHTAIPLTKVEVCRLPVNDLLTLKQQSPEVEAMMMQRWIQSLHDAEDMLVELGAKKATERLAVFLVRWCHATPEESSDWVKLPLTRGEMGELLGMTVETVSRTVSYWKREGWLEEKQGSMRIVDADSLCQSVSDY